jgi:hypothetical protein
MPGSVRILVSIVALLGGAALVGLPGGCSRKSPPGPATVRGKVTYQGEPLADGLIVFTPDPDRGGGGKPARGDLDENGQFQLKLGDDTAIPTGWYRVSFARSPATYFKRPQFPAELSRPDKSGQVREVKAGQENVFEFTIEVPER